MMQNIEKKRILLVEDEEILLNVNSKIVESFGYSVICASTGEEAIDKITKELTVNLILMDIDLGEGIDGTETAKQILENNDLPIVFLSSHTEPEIVSKTEKITSYGYIVKGSSHTVMDISLKMAFKLFESKQLEKRRNEELLKSQNRLKLAQASGNIGTWDLDLQSNTLVWDSIMFDLYGVNPENFHELYEDWEKWIHPEDRPMVVSQFQESVREKKSFFSEFRIITTHGRIKFIEAHGIIILSKYDEPERMIGINIDITKRRESEEITLENEQRFYKAFEFAPIGMALVSLNGNWLRVNKALCNMFGYTEIELLSTNFQNLTHPEDLGKDLIMVNKMLNREVKGYNLEKRYFHKDKKIIHSSLNVSLVCDKNNNPQYFISQIVDITERRELEENLKSSEEKYRSLLNTLQEGVWVIDENNNTTFTNPRLGEILGYTKEEMDGKNLFYFMDERGIEITKRNIERRKQGIREQHEFELLHKNGNRLYTIMEAAPLFDREGVYSGAIAGVLDITERKMNEEKISNLLKEKEIILQEIHHRIKNNISNVIGFIEIGMNELRDNESITILKETQGRIMSMMKLYDKLYRSADYENISSKEYLETIVQQIINNHPNLISLEIKKFIQDIRINSKIISSLGIITNEILTNALKYAFTNNQIGIIEISAKFENRRGELIIQDNGKGLPDVMNFENSSGFGFTLIEMMVKQLKGSIQISRSKGTKFQIQFSY